MALNFKITYTSLGLDSLKDIHNYLEDRIDVDTADRITAGIGRFISNMSYNPFMGRIISEYDLKTNDVRRITTFDKRYNIYYRVDEQVCEIYILKIVDGRQSVKHQLLGL